MHACIAAVFCLVLKVQEIGDFQSTLSRGSHVAAPFEQLRQQLSAKEEECRQKDVVIRDKETVIEGKNEALWHLDHIIRENEVALSKKDETLRQHADTIRAQQIEIHRLTHKPAMAEAVSRHTI